MKNKGKVYKDGKIYYSIGRINEKENLMMEFETSLNKRVYERITQGFIKTYKPVMDDTPYRVFDKIGDYRKWCEKFLPEWLGYGREK